MSHKEPHLICCCKDGPQGATGLQGPHGNDGVQGAQGIQGPLGPQGVQGAIGIDGIQGIPGDGGTNNTTPGSIGVQGPEGPEGNYGTQGIPGVNGVDGLDGTAGANFQNYSNVYYDGLCNPVNAGTVCTACLQCEGWSSPGSLDGSRIFNNKTGTGFARVEMGFNVPFGNKLIIVGMKGAAGYFFRSQSGIIFEMSAYNSFTANISTNGTPFPPFKGMHLEYSQGQGSNIIEVLHIGNNRWVVIKANLNNGQLPLFI
jgi:hypothetical protein